MTKWLAGLHAAGFGCCLLGGADGAFAQRELKGSEAVRAERCAGDYVCDEDGSWQATYLCPWHRVSTSEATGDSTDQATASAHVQVSTQRVVGRGQAGSDR
jgi:hypothetical protein